MAFDAYLKLDGIDGASKDGAHGDQIDLEEFNVGVEQEPATRRGATSAGRTDIKPITFVHIFDKSVPLLLKKCAGGEKIASGKVSVNQTMLGKTVEVMSVELTDIVISNVEIKAVPKGTAGESGSQPGGELYCYTTVVPAIVAVVNTDGNIKGGYDQVKGAVV